MRRRLVAPLTFACLAAGALPAQDSPEEEKAALDIFREVAEKIVARAYKPEPLPVICTKALAGVVAKLPPAAQPHARDLSRLDDSAALAGFAQSIRALRGMPGQRQTFRDLVEAAIEAWCFQHDPYTRYVPAQYGPELIRLLTSGQGSVGMSLQEKNDGHFYCYPRPDSPASLAGIKNGDRLLAVNGIEAAGKPIQLIGSMIRGAPGSTVQVRILQAFGNREKTVGILCEALKTPNVTAESLTTSLRLAIRKFTPDVVKEVRAELARATPDLALALDLRGNEGGELEAAVALASLFMEPGETIVTLRERDKPDDVRVARGPREFKAPLISIKQDEGTASAAEMLIAALVGSPSNRAVSNGSKTYGKAVYQAVIQFKHGGFLTLTTGEMIAPQGRSWEQTGLLPSSENLGRIFAK